MTGAMYAAVSGMKSHMGKLNVIGNNVANVNTYGYKAARTTFRESIYSTLTGGSNGSRTSGGVNPAQLGYGCSIGTIDLDMSTKNYVPTGVGLDCMINGDGFFLVGSKPGVTTGTGTVTPDITDAQSLYLSRVGDFKFIDGYLCDGAGNVVYGFVTCAGTAGTGTGAGQSSTPGTTDKDDPLISTQLVPIRLPLAAAADNTSVTPNIKQGDPIYPGVDSNGQNVYDDGTDTDGYVSVDSISIDPKTGMITAVPKDGDGPIVIGYIALASVGNPEGVTHIQGPYYRALEGAGTCEAVSIGGVLEGYELDNGVPTNAKLIGGSGETNLITGGLESSGTDLATEFSEMISTQRGYQANTRIITVTDSMLEELVNMKR